MRLPVPGPRDVWNMLERGADSVEQLLAAVPRVVALLDEAETMLTRVSRVIAQIEETQTAALKVVRRTDEVADQAEELVGRTTPLLDRMEPSLVALQPTLDRLAETTDAREVDALVTMIDLLPDLAVKMETHVIPILDSLSSVAPDLHDLLDVSRELNEMLGTVPGLGRIKKRIDEEQADEGRG